MIERLLRATGADLPFGRPEAGHPGVKLESWFWRLVAPDGSVVLLALTRVGEHEDEWLSVVLAARHADGTRSLVERAFTEVDSADDALRLRASGDGTLRVDRTRLAVDLGVDGALGVDLADAWRWPRRALGGLGLGHVVPLLSQYWHPHTLGARVRGEARFGGRTVALAGAEAYGEKNWGRGGTPRAWWWGQAACAPGVVLAFAGGVLDVGPARVPATAIAVRLGDDLAAFSPPLALVTARVEPGRWALDARGTRYRVRIRATADGAPFALPVPVPGQRRTELLSHQHQAGHLELQAWDRGRLRFDGGSELAGLERGGAELHRATG